MRCCNIETTVSEYEKYAGKAPKYSEGDLSDWACELLRWLADSLGSCFAVVGAHGARVVNSGAPIDPIMAGCLVGKHMIQPFTVYTDSRPSLSSLSRRLTTTYQTRAAAGLILPQTRLTTASDDAFRKYMPISLQFENDFPAWLSRLEAVIPDGTDCIRNLLEFYEPPRSINHAATMALTARKPGELAQQFSALHSAAVCLVCWSECGNFMHLQRYLPPQRPSFSEVAWTVRRGHIQPFQLNRCTLPGEYPTLEADQFPRMNVTWQTRLSQPGFVRRASVEYDAFCGATETTETICAYGDDFPNQRRLPKLTQDQRRYLAHLKSNIMSAIPGDLLESAGQYMFLGHTVYVIYKGQQFQMRTPAHNTETTIALSYIKREVRRLRVTKGPEGVVVQRLIEITHVDTAMTRTPVQREHRPQAGKRSNGIPMRAAAIYLLYRDPYYFAYFPAYTPLGRGHTEELTGKTPEEIIAYCRGVIQPRLDRGQEYRLKRAAKVFKRRYHISRPTHVVHGGIMVERAPSTLGSF